MNKGWANITPLKKGQGGRKKGALGKRPKAIQQLARDVLSLDLKTGKRMTASETELYFKKLIDKHPTAMRHFLEHAHGKPKETHDINIKSWKVAGPQGEAIVKKEIKKVTDGR